MSTKPIHGPCQHCGGNLAFPAESIGQTAPCPHCGRQTELLLATPATTPAIPTRSIIYLVLAVLILAGGTVALLLRLKHQQKIIAQKQRSQSQPATPPAPATPETIAAAAGFQISAIQLQKTTGTSLVHATGTLKNRSGRKCFGLKIQLNVLDAQGQKIGTATDQISTLDPDAEWKFNALVFTPKAASATLASISEQP